jgi:hypothetical protein
MPLRSWRAPQKDKPEAACADGREVPFYWL